MKTKSETAILAGGCFWGMQALIRQIKGVTETQVGYTGGNNDNPTYRNHPGHAEAIKITFDPDRVSFRALLQVFFQIHDPTTRDRQGNDIGSSYRSAIFYTSEAQREQAARLIDEMNASGIWPGAIVTELEQAKTFWPAEAEHQDYLQQHPQGYTCHFPRPDWVLPE